MDHWGNFFQKTGQAGYDFWQTTVKPHKKLWLASGALAVILITPEKYTDYAINKMGDGIEKSSRNRSGRRKGSYYLHR